MVASKGRDAVVDRETVARAVAMNASTGTRGVERCEAGGDEAVEMRRDVG
jgi:hypothetical protein